MTTEFDIKGSAGPKGTAQAAFDSACGFFEGALRCSEPVANPYKPNTITSPTAPTIVTIAFSCELYLKSLILRTKSEVNGHRLDRLFNDLSNDLQKKVRKRYCSLFGCRALDFKGHLIELSNAFVDFRYIYEKSAQIGLAKLFSLARAIYEVIREECPEWKVDEYLHSRFTAELVDHVLHVAYLGGGHTVRVTKMP